MAQVKFKLYVSYGINEISHNFNFLEMEVTFRDLSI